MTDPQERTIRYLRLSLTDRCNLRCTYCMPEEGIEHRRREELLDFDEIEAVVGAFARWGVSRVRLTGGEPTVRRDVVALVGRLSQIEDLEGRRISLAMTTNGTRLRELARPLWEAGLSELTVSLDSLDSGRFAQVARRDCLDEVMEGIDAACAAGFQTPRLKLNTVAMRGFNDIELGALVRFAWEHNILPRFIEAMPMSSGELFVPGEFMTAAQVRGAVEAQLGLELEPCPTTPGSGVGPARYWQVRGDEHRKVGTIGALSENFCDSCNRLRLSANGELHNCLARDEAGSIKEALRHGSPEALEQAVRGIVAGKAEGHRFERDGAGGPQKSMISIGG